jgi:hypothetical protein
VKTDLMERPLARLRIPSARITGTVLAEAWITPPEWVSS